MWITELSTRACWDRPFPCIGISRLNDQIQNSWHILGKNQDWQSQQSLRLPESTWCPRVNLLSPVVIFNQPFSPQRLKAKSKKHFKKMTAAPLKTRGNFHCMSTVHLIRSNTGPSDLRAILAIPPGIPTGPSYPLSTPLHSGFPFFPTPTDGILSKRGLPLPSACFRQKVYVQHTSSYESS